MTCSRSAARGETSEWPPARSRHGLCRLPRTDRLLPRQRARRGRLHRGAGPSRRVRPVPRAVRPATDGQVRRRPLLLRGRPDRPPAAGDGPDPRGPDPDHRGLIRSHGHSFERLLRAFRPRRTPWARPAASVARVARRTPTTASVPTADRCHTHTHPRPRGRGFVVSGPRGHDGPMADRVTVLDGGLSTALEARGADLGGALWTARLLADEPERIAAAHRAFYLAGAQVATTASYQVSVEGLVAAGHDPVAAGRLVARSVTLVREVRDELADSRDGLLVAASVGPYGAFLADGSEYRGRYGVSTGRLRDFHGPRLELLAEAGPDLFAVETIPDSDEAEVLVPLLDELGVPA